MYICSVYILLLYILYVIIIIYDRGLEPRYNVAKQQYDATSRLENTSFSWCVVVLLVYIINTKHCRLTVISMILSFEAVN